jgi:DUF4097 and DUF4098 domain-containing protein YvlB
MCMLAATACTSASGHFDQTLTVGNTPHVRINCPAGSVIVRGGAPGSVSVLADFKVKALDPSRIVERLENKPPISASGNSVTIGTSDTSHSGFLRRYTFHYQIVVPSDAEVTTNLGMGDTRVSGLDARLTINSGMGRVDLSEFSGDATINNGMGGVNADHFSGRLKVNTGTGGLHVRANQMKEGMIELETGAGNVEITDLRGGLRLHTGTGSIKVSGAPSSDWTIENGTGSIDIGMAQKAAFNLRADSGTGNVSIAHPLMTVSAQSGRHIEGKANGGGPLVTLKTGTGNININ